MICATLDILRVNSQRKQSLIPQFQIVPESFNAIYAGPKSGSKNEVPLIMRPHGGPFGIFSNSFSHDDALFILLGYAMLLVNYRGSLGQGKKSSDFIMGRIGSADVSDCYFAVQAALERFVWLDSNRLILVGASHGGFIVTHLSARYPNTFKVVVAKNPVIDVSLMSLTSDLNDW